MADRVKELGLPTGTGVSTFIQEHQLEIEGTLHAMAKACNDYYIALLDGLIRHFEQSAIKKEG